MLRLSDYLYKNEELNMKKTIKLTESDLHRIIEESVKRVLNESEITEQADSFSIAMDKLYTLLKDEIGGDSMRETIADWFWQDWDGETRIVPCKYDDMGMSELLYALCNYDAICLNDDGSVDIENSNDPEIARVIKPYVKREIGMRIVHNLYNR